MSPTKLLQINPTLFSVNSSGNNKSLKNKAVKPQITNNKMNPNRKVLLAKIKDFQKKDRENKQKEKQNNSNSTENEKEEIDDFEGEFNKSLNFLQELSNKHTLKRKEKKNRTLKKPIDVGNNVNLELPNELKENEITILPSVSSILDQKQPIKNEQLEPSNIQNTIANTTSTNTSTNSNSNANRIEDNAITNLQKPLIQKPIQNLVLSSSLPLPPPIQISQPLQSTSITSSPPPIILSGPPPYSNLKGTVKPTYREWIQKTQKNYKNKNSNISFSDKNHTSDDTISIGNVNINSDTHKQTIPTLNLSSPILKNIQNHKSNEQINSKTNTDTVLTKIPIQKINKKTRTLKYTLGKKGSKIGVLIKNSNTRKKIKDDFLKLKKKNITEIKDALRNKNLIKAGTLAPNDVLREIYEQSILTGDVVNKNKDALIHNYFSDK